MPFCVHPDTGKPRLITVLFYFLGKICVPLHLDDIESFDPDSCPVLSDVLQQFRDTKGTKMNGANFLDCIDLSKTDLGPYLQAFTRYVSALVPGGITIRYFDQYFINRGYENYRALLKKIKYSGFHNNTYI